MKKLQFYLTIFICLHHVNKVFSQNIDGGYHHSIFICGDGSARTCGLNMYGQLGDGTHTSKNIPVPVIGLSGIIFGSAGYGHSLFLKNDGTVWACGENANGELGDGTNTDKNIPVKVNGISGIITVSAGEGHSLFLKNDGTVWACGGNGNGQLGDGTNLSKKVPAQINGLNGIVSISAGDFHSLFLKNDGTVWACGLNISGQLGDGTNILKNTPIQVNGLSEIVSVSAGRYHSLFIKRDGTVWACGNNNYGQLGIGPYPDINIPEKINGLSSISSISAGGDHSFFLKEDGSVWGCGKNLDGELGDGNNTNKNVPVKVNAPSILYLSVSVGSNHSLLLMNDGRVWSSGGNIDGQLGNGTNSNKNIPVQVQNLCYVKPPEKNFSHYLKGNLYGDTNSDCKIQAAEPGIPYIALNAMPGNLYAFSDDTGAFSIGINDSVNYTLKPIIPQQFSYMLKNPCPADYVVSLPANSVKDTLGFDLGFDFIPCHHLRVSVASNRRRRCFRNMTTVSYWNEGLASANNAEVRLKLPPYVIPISASHPYTWDANDSSLVFSVGTLGAQQSGTITLVDSVACVNGIMGLTQCTKAWILPPNQCYIDSTTGSNWDQSSVKVDATCVNDTVRFVIYNKGSGNMSSPSPYRIYADHVLQQSNTFQLVSGDSLVIKIVSGGATMRLEADQNPGHPGNSHPATSIEGCGTNASGQSKKGMIDQMPQDEEDPDVSIDCMEIIDSYDPNYKASSPSGIGSQKLVLPGTALDFVIHFQNNGSDTAYKVVVVDTLSNDYDLSTFLPGASSHPYKTSISGEGAAVLTFTFDKINLVDSATNEPGSNGFVSYRISPKQNLPLGTKLDNKAGIFFDYNFPIITNNAFVTLGNFNLSVGIKHQPSIPEFLRAYPNPAADEITVESAFQLEKIIIYTPDGRRHSEIQTSSKKTVLNLSNFTPGFYILDCRWQGGSGKLKLVKE